jgi:hypothetical protein
MSCAVFVRSRNIIAPLSLHAGVACARELNGFAGIRLGASLLGHEGKLKSTSRLKPYELGHTLEQNALIIRGPNVSNAGLRKQHNVSDEN